MKNNEEILSTTIYHHLKSGRYTHLCQRIRDLTKINIGKNFSLIAAADSDGGIGNLPNDVVKCSEYTLGRFAIRVPLMEIIACGAVPLAAFDMLTVSMDVYGKEIIRGIRAELKEAGLNEDFPLSGSTEDNIPTTMTGIGTLVLGLVEETDFRPGSSRKGDSIFCIGKPKSGPDDEVSVEDNEIIQQHHLRDIMQLDHVHDVLPVGSRGVLYEAGQVAVQAGLNFIPNLSHKIDMKKSAGPCTCVLVSCLPSAEKDLVNKIEISIEWIGSLSNG